MTRGDRTIGARIDEMLSRGKLGRKKANAFLIYIPRG